MIVSIPYRLATNNYPMFIFFKNLKVSIPYRLATNLSGLPHQKQKNYQFQSLIGWLQTNFLKRVQVQLTKVSIPYRLATNIVCFTCINIIKSMFQSLIGWLQTWKKIYEKVWTKFRFQSLIGWLQTKIELLLMVIFSSFNPLQVGYKQY